jgi:hypothetical protein
VIARGEPAIMVCHWPGIYFNGEKVGFNIFKQIVERLHTRYDNLIWMKLSEIARYWAAKELTRIEKTPTGLRLHAPFASPLFTLRCKARPNTPPKIVVEGKPLPLREVKATLDLTSNTWSRSGDDTATICFDLAKGLSEVVL